MQACGFQLVQEMAKHNIHLKKRLMFLLRNIVSSLVESVIRDRCCYIIFLITHALKFYKSDHYEST